MYIHIYYIANICYNKIGTLNKWRYRCHHCLVPIISYIIFNISIANRNICYNNFIGHNYIVLYLIYVYIL